MAGAALIRAWAILGISFSVQRLADRERKAKKGCGNLPRAIPKILRYSFHQIRNKSQLPKLRIDAGGRNWLE